MVGHMEDSVSWVIYRDWGWGGSRGMAQVLTPKSSEFHSLHCMTSKEYCPGGPNPTVLAASAALSAPNWPLEANSLQEKFPQMNAESDAKSCVLQSARWVLTAVQVRRSGSELSAASLCTWGNAQIPQRCFQPGELSGWSWTF